MAHDDRSDHEASVPTVAVDEHESALEALLARVNGIVTSDVADDSGSQLLSSFGQLDPAVVADVAAARTDRLGETLVDVVNDRPTDPGGSRYPGGALVHQFIATITRRRDESLLREIRALARATEERLDEISSRIDAVEGRLNRLDQSGPGAGH